MRRKSGGHSTEETCAGNRIIPPESCPAAATSNTSRLCKSQLNHRGKNTTVRTESQVTWQKVGRRRAARARALPFPSTGGIPAGKVRAGVTAARVTAREEENIRTPIHTHRELRVHRATAAGQGGSGTRRPQPPRHSPARPGVPVREFPSDPCPSGEQRQRPPRGCWG